MNHGIAILLENYVVLKRNKLDLSVSTVLQDTLSKLDNCRTVFLQDTIFIKSCTYMSLKCLENLTESCTLKWAVWSRHRQMIRGFPVMLNFYVLSQNVLMNYLYKIFSNLILKDPFLPLSHFLYHMILNPFTILLLLWLLFLFVLKCGTQIGSNIPD